MATRYLYELAHGRSGDKGDVSNICLFARNPEDYELLKAQVTAEAVKAHFGPMVKGTVTRYELPLVNGFNFVLKGALDGGATQSLRLDTLGKTMATALMHLKIDDGKTA